MHPVLSYRSVAGGCRDGFAPKWCDLGVILPVREDQALGLVALQRAATALFRCGGAYPVGAGRASGLSFLQTNVGIHPADRP